MHGIIKTRVIPSPHEDPWDFAARLVTLLAQVENGDILIRYNDEINVTAQEVRNASRSFFEIHGVPPKVAAALQREEFMAISEARSAEKQRQAHSNRGLIGRIRTTENRPAPRGGRFSGPTLE